MKMMKKFERLGGSHMTARAIRETANQSILPVLLGNTGRAHRLSARLFRRFGVVSLICGRPSLSDLADFTSVTLRMPKTDCERLWIETIVGFAEEYREPLLLLVPCSKEAKSLLSTHASVLEEYGILLDEETVFSASPLSFFEEYVKSPLS